MAVSIAKASVYLDELLSCIENIYWEANDIPSKDVCFNLIRLLQSELTELNKVSVQDHHYDYEIIAYPPTTVIEAVEALQSHLKNMVLRTQTRVQVMPLLENRNDYF
ncbi:hypothetical protein HF888_11290 [Bermanella marisrubri]|uniref:Uncharacterized protein n=1 Tax=Bermanella marisrubri TaxID=207949 RepID=Q1N189_9GAMM|nr:hypothetical protein [Bermanella marisrubri]EAT11962.1 hypothetical protein RED65_11495 [Oceanobacter sp. RED65] [Bermanella marisrubri]QIZ84766.1 hypothetical protein HF888_11290 [Bermanella marisrubri]